MFLFVFTHTMKGFSKPGTFLESNMAITCLDSSMLTSALGGVKSLGWTRKRLPWELTQHTQLCLCLRSLLVQFQTSRGSSEQGPADLVWVRGGVTVSLWSWAGRPSFLPDSFLLRDKWEARPCLSQVMGMSCSPRVLLGHAS